MPDLVSSTVAAAKKIVIGCEVHTARRHALRHANRIRRIARVAQAGNPARLDAEVRETIKCFGARLTAVVRAARKKKRELTYGDALALANRLDLRKDCDEIIHASFREKTDGSYRPISSFGLERTARQRLAKDILEAAGVAHPADYSVRGRGVNAACDRIRELVLDEGCEHFLVADIKNCFGSFERNAVASFLPLPERVVHNTILIPDTAKLVIHTPDINTNIKRWEDAARRGIPQGSPASSLVASALIGPLLDQLPDATRVVVVADDMLFGACSEADVNAIKLALTEALKSHPAGPLSLKHVHIRTTQQGFNFLGYRFRRRPEVFGGMFYAHPSPQSFKRFKARLWERTTVCPFDDIFEVGWEYAEAWRRSFSRWDRHELGDAYFENTVNITLGDVGVTRLAKKAS